MNTYGALQHIGISSSTPSLLDRSFIEDDSRYTTAVDTTPLLFRYTSRVRGRRLLDDTMSRNALINWKVSALIILFMSGVIIGCYLLSTETNNWPTNFPYYLIELNNWYGGNTKNDSIPWLPMKQIPYLIVSHTQTDHCDTFIHCINIMKHVMINHNLFDIPFNFLISNSGETYEVRGWRFSNGFTNTPIYNESLAIGFIGDFRNQKPTNEQFQELEAFINHARGRGQLRSDYKIYGIKTDGKFMHQNLRKMSHFNGFVNNFS